MRAERHLQAVLLARDCNALGARTRTMHHVTGLPPRQLRCLFACAMNTPRGRAPNSPEWYHSANLLFRTESSIVMSLYRRLRDGGFAAGESLVAAYRHYQTICRRPQRISFDRAFDLASHTDGIWLAKTSAFSVVTCPVCGSEFLAAVGAVASIHESCPFCKLVRRYATDPRIQSSFPTHPRVDPRWLRQRILALIHPGPVPHETDDEKPAEQALFWGDTPPATPKDHIAPLEPPR